MTTRKPLRKTTPAAAPRKADGTPEDQNPQGDSEEETPMSPEDSLNDNDSPNENGDDDSEDDTEDADAEEGKNAPEKPVEDPTVVEIRKYPGAPRGGHIVGPDGPITVKGVVIGKLVRISAPVYQARRLRGSSRWRFHQLYAKGSEIPLAQVQVVDNEAEKVVEVPTAEVKSFEVKGSGHPEIKQD